MILTAMRNCSRNNHVQIYWNFEKHSFRNLFKVSLYFSNNNKSRSTVTCAFVISIKRGSHGPQRSICTIVSPERGSLSAKLSAAFLQLLEVMRCLISKLPKHSDGQRSDHSNVSARGSTASTKNLQKSAHIWMLNYRQRSRQSSHVLCVRCKSIHCRTVSQKSYVLEYFARQWRSNIFKVNNTVESRSSTPLVIEFSLRVMGNFSCIW